MTTISAIQIIEQRAGKTVCEITNETGSATMTRWTVFPGIELVYLDAHMQYFFCRTKPIPNGFAINHCEEGRIECEFENGTYLYMEQNDISVGWRRSQEYSHSSFFPLSHYHGVSVLFRIDEAQPVLRQLLGRDAPDLAAFCNQFCQGSEFGIVMKENNDIKHLFYELYHVPEAIRRRYCQLKVQEILLFLSTAHSMKKKDAFLTGRQVQIVKQVHADLTDHLQRKTTIEALAAQYHIAPTTLKRCFKSVYGASMRQYLKRYRIEAAKRMLTGTDTHILDIAALVGYGNSSKFAMAFQAETGLLPHEYRKKMQRK